MRLSLFTDTWVAQNDLIDASPWVQYSWSLFASLSQMLCIGYGRYPPDNIPEVWMTIFSMSVGAALFAGIIGAISATLLNLDASANMYNSKKDQLTQYMRYRQLPPELRERIRTHFEQRYATTYTTTLSLRSSQPTALARLLIASVHEMASCTSLIKLFL